MADVIDFESRYKAAQPLMDAGDYAALIPLLDPLADAILDGEGLNAGGAVSDVTAGSILSNLGVCKRETGYPESADLLFATASHSFAYSQDLSARFVAAQADYLRAALLRDTGKKVAARDVLSDMTMRIMMDDDPGMRHMFTMGLTDMRALEAEVGPARYGEPAAKEPASKYEPFTYSKTANAFESTQRSWRFEADRIICTRNGQSRAIPHDMIKGLHFLYAPTRFVKSRYVMTIQTSDGGREEIDNIDYVRVADFTDRTRDYRMAVAALTDQLQAKGAKVAVTSGRSWPYYALMVACTVFFLLVVLLTFLVGGLIGIAVKLVVLALMAPRLIGWFKHNRPGTGTLDALPPGVMP